MGVSTNAEICYGIPFEESSIFPWDKHSEVDWWRSLKGYKPLCGNYIDGKEPERSVIDQYHDHRREWDKQNPFPIEVHLHCSNDCPMYILGVKGTHLMAFRGCPESFEPNRLIVPEENLSAFEQFINTYVNLEQAEGELGWYLFSFWG